MGIPHPQRRLTTKRQGSAGALTTARQGPGGGPAGQPLPDPRAACGYQTAELPLMSAVCAVALRTATVDTRFEPGSIVRSRSAAKHPSWGPNHHYRAEIMDLRSRCYSPRSVVGQRLRLPSRLFRLLPRSDPEVADGLCFALRSAHRAAGAPLHALKALRELPACVRAHPGGTAVTSRSTSFRTTSANRVGAIPCLSSVGRAQAPRRAARCGLA